MARKMTRRRATEILIRYTVKYMEGSGVGLREVPSRYDRWKAAEAIKRLWRDAYDWDVGDDWLMSHRLPTDAPAPEKHDG